MFGPDVPPHPEWSRPPFVYDADATAHFPPSILLNSFFLPADFRDDEGGGGFIDSNQPGALTELSSLLTLQHDPTICAGSDLPQLPPEGAWGSQPTDDFDEDTPFIPPSVSNRSYSSPIASNSQPEYPATQQTTTQYQNYNIDPRLYQVRVRHTFSSMADFSSPSHFSPPAPTPVTIAEVQLHQITVTRVGVNEAMGLTEALPQVLNLALRAIPSTPDITTVNSHPINLPIPSLLQFTIPHTTATTNASGWNTREKTR